MAKKTAKLKEDNIIDFLNSELNTTANPSDPISESVISVTLDQLQPFELNPRRTEGDNYQVTYDSIESVGLKHPPTITRRKSEDEKLSIRDGGNTRLKILRLLHEKYQQLATESTNEAEKQTLLAKANSFFHIKCRFIPFHSDLDALSGHMIENEARSSTKFIERALVVEQFKKLFQEADEQDAQEAGQVFEYKELSSRVLASRITQHGWPVQHSHIVRYKYAAMTLIHVIPNALWAGAGEPLIRNIKSLYKAYDTFWLSTDQGRADPDLIEQYFYDTLTEFDDDKVDLINFRSDLDEKLSSVVGEPPFVISTEINAIQNNTTQSLKDNPDALRESRAAQSKLAEQVAQQDKLDAAQKQTTIENRQTVSTPTPSAPPVTADIDTLSQVAKSPTDAQPDQQQSQTEQPFEQAPVTPLESILPSPPPVDRIKYDQLPNNINDLRDLLEYHLKNIEAASTGFIGLTICREDSAESEEVKLVQGHIFYHMYDFAKKPSRYPDQFPFPVFQDETDDLRSAIWLSLFIASRVFTKNFLNFGDMLDMVLMDYIAKLKNGPDGPNTTPVNSLVATIFYLQHTLMRYPDIYIECQQVHLIQAKILHILQSSQ